MPGPRREHNPGRVSHPDPLRLDTGRSLELIEDPIADRLAKGDPILGWEGDERLALYFDRRERTWELFRLEHDGIYRATIRLNADEWRGPDAVAEMVLRLLRTDTRRGHDPLVVMESARAQRDREMADRQAAFVDETADRLAHALVKDGV